MQYLNAEGDESMKKIRSLNNYQKSILIFMLVMSMIFAVIYSWTLSRVGYRYMDAILVPAEENENIVYSGKIKGKQAEFTVSDQNTVVFKYGDKTYGPYTIREDEAAIPQDNEMSSSMTGIEVREKDDIMFRGGVVDLGDFYWLYNEDGTSDNIISVTYVTSDRIERDEEGNPFDKLKPSALTIYELTNTPELTHKGDVKAWAGAVFLCILNALSLLFADELFQWNLAFQIRNAEQAEPSDWEIAGRYISWTVMTIIALVIFILGLQ